VRGARGLRWPTVQRFDDRLDPGHTAGVGFAATAATVISAIEAAKTPEVTHVEQVMRLCVDRPPSTAFKRE
jgi:hypothetical protein